MSERSGTPNVLGILSIVFGAIVVALTLLAFGFDPMDSPLMNDIASLRSELETLRAALEPWATIGSVVMVVMGASLIVIGVGQRGYRGWAVSATTIWSVVALAVTAAQVANQLLVVNPALHRFMEEVLPGRLGRELMGSQGVSSIFILLLLYLPYPIVQLVLIRKPEVVASMRA